MTVGPSCSGPHYDGSGKTSSPLYGSIPEFNPRDEGRTSENVHKTREEKSKVVRNMREK